MSAYEIRFDENRKKIMVPIESVEQFIALRNTPRQQRLVKRARNGEPSAKKDLLQVNYSCVPGEDNHLKGCSTPSKTVGMDIDLVREEGEETEAFEARINQVADHVLSLKADLGLRMLELSAGKGLHVVFDRHVEMDQEANLRWASDLIGVPFDEGAKDITRVFYSSTASGEDLRYVSEKLFDNEPATLAVAAAEPEAEEPVEEADELSADEGLTYLGIPYSEIIDKWWQMYYEGRTPVRSNRDTCTYELSVNLRHICGHDRRLLDKVVPCYDGFSYAEKMKCIDSALSVKLTQMPRRMRDLLAELRREHTSERAFVNAVDEVEQQADLQYVNRITRGARPQGISDSMNAAHRSMGMAVITAVCPAIGALATGVKLVVHGQPNNLNLISFIVGMAGSGKGSLDPIIDAWMTEIKAQDEVYYASEESQRVRQRAAKNAKVQPEVMKFPVRYITLNNTLANLTERLANAQGKHCFSFTPEADLVTQKWRSGLSDFSVMLRQGWDGTGFQREAKSVDAVNAHIENLLWNVDMAGTPDALHRLIGSTTDGLLSRLAIARTPDNTFQPLDDRPCLLTDHQRERIAQVAHLLGLMEGTVSLPKLEQRSRDWVERVRLEAVKNDDPVMARCRLRDHITAYRMTCCIMLCAVSEKLIRQYGISGAENDIRSHPHHWQEMLAKCQTPSMLDAYDAIADSLIDNDLYYFRERLESDQGRSQRGTRPRRYSKNDSIFERLPETFMTEQAYQQCVAVKGQGVSSNTVKMMLRNWKNQGLVERIEDGRYRKVVSRSHECHVSQSNNTVNPKDGNYDE